MNTRARRLAFLLVFALAAPLASAAPRKAPARAGAPDVSAGYSYTQAGDAGLHGWTLSGSHPWRSLSFVADLSGHYGSFAGADMSQLALLAGVRRSWHFTALSPFAEVLVGGARLKTSVEGSLDDSTASFGAALGGGAERTLSGRWAARVGLQLRLLHGAGVWDEDPRVSIGIVYRLSR